MWREREKGAGRRRTIGKFGGRDKSKRREKGGGEKGGEKR